MCITYRVNLFDDSLTAWSCHSYHVWVCTGGIYIYILMYSVCVYICSMYAIYLIIISVCVCACVCVCGVCVCGLFFHKTTPQQHLKGYRSRFTDAWLTLSRWVLLGSEINDDVRGEVTRGHSVSACSHFDLLIGMRCVNLSDDLTRKFHKFPPKWIKEYMSLGLNIITIFHAYFSAFWRKGNFRFEGFWVTTSQWGRNFLRGGVRSQRAHLFKNRILHNDVLN